MRSPQSSTRRRFTRFGIGVATTLVLVACSGGSDSAESPASDSGDGAADAPTGATIELSGTIEALIGDGATSFTITVPDGFALDESLSGSSVSIDDPSLEFGERTTDVGLIYLPAPSTAQELVDDWMDINSTITVFEQADEDGLSWFTYMTPSSSNPDKIAFGTANTSLALPDGTGLECRTITQNGIDEEWSEDDARAMADANLAICKSLMAP